MVVAVLYGGRRLHIVSADRPASPLGLPTAGVAPRPPRIKAFKLYYADMACTSVRLNLSPTAGVRGTYSQRLAQHLRVVLTESV